MSILYKYIVLNIVFIPEDVRVLIVILKSATKLFTLYCAL